MTASLATGAAPPPPLACHERRAEWLEADGLGGFAMGTVSGVRTRRYHAVLQAALRPPTRRVVLVNGFDAFVRLPGGERLWLTSQRYHPGVTLPDAAGSPYADGAERIIDFRLDPWPTWTLRLDDNSAIVHELVSRHGSPLVLLRWCTRDHPPPAPPSQLELVVRPFLSGRDAHDLHHENPFFDSHALETPDEGRVRWQPYPSLPVIEAISNGAYEHAPLWYRGFEYDEDLARGLDAIEDLLSPGEFRFDLSRGDAVLAFAVRGGPWPGPLDAEDADALAAAVRAAERKRRSAFPSLLHRSADAYFARRGDGITIVAGYPWFTDWGRDTFVAMRGLALAGGRLPDARRIVLAWADAVSEGQIPNYFPERAETPAYNAVDASLWFVIAAGELLRLTDDSARLIHRAERQRIVSAMESIVEGYTKGTRFGIRVDDDGLVAAGVPGSSLTWMDARVGETGVTPRIGKPVEVQALWINALAMVAECAPRRSARWQAMRERAQRSFDERFWNAEQQMLYDVVDVAHVGSTVDASLRPNQVFAIGGLPEAVLHGERARRVVDVLEEQLLTPFGLRSLAAGDPRYRPRYEGGPNDRDASYHQGTVWCWLIGPFVEAWVRVHGGGAAARAQARERFLEPLLGHLSDAGLGHLPEIADGDAPHAPRGAPFQAWSLGEVMRLAFDVTR